MSEIATASTPGGGEPEPSGAESMVFITPVAAAKVNEIRDAEGIEPNMALRLRVVGGGCAGFSYDLYFDEPAEVDRQVEIQGVKVVVDEMSLMYLVGTEIDYVERLQGAVCKFSIPNTKATCACGSAFSVERQARVMTPVARLHDDRIVGVLERELGAAAIVGPGHERLDDYGHDESPLPEFYPPACAALVESTEQAAAVLRICLERKVPVTPRGAGSGMCGGALPIHGGVVLSTERMTRIKEIDAGDLICVTEPGVVTGRLQEAVEAQQLFYPPDPASLEFCSIGGNASTNAGGLRAFKYGVTREYVLGLEVALMGGEVLRCGRRTSKGVTSYDLVAGFVGTEGTFGVITELTLKLLPLPMAAATVLGVFADVPAAGSAITMLLRGGLRPRVLELADKASIDHVRPKSRYRFPANAGAIVLIEVDGEPDTMAMQMEQIGLRCDDLGAIDVLAATEPAERRALWEARRLISPSLKEAF